MEQSIKQVERAANAAWRAWDGSLDPSAAVAADEDQAAIEAVAEGANVIACLRCDDVTGAREGAARAVALAARWGRSAAWAPVLALVEQSAQERAEALWTSRCAVASIEQTDDGTWAVTIGEGQDAVRRGDACTRRQARSKALAAVSRERARTITRAQRILGHVDAPYMGVTLLTAGRCPVVLRTTETCRPAKAGR